SPSSSEASCLPSVGARRRNKVRPRPEMVERSSEKKALAMDAGRIRRKPNLTLELGCCRSYSSAWIVRKYVMAWRYSRQDRLAVCRLGFLRLLSDFCRRLAG